MDRKLRGMCHFWGAAGFPFNTMWPGPRPTCTPSFILIHPIVWPHYTNITDRQDRTGQDRQTRSDRTGWTILQRVAQNGWTNRDAVWHLHLVAPQEACIRWGTHRQIPLKYPCAMAMRPVVKLLWPLRYEFTTNYNRNIYSQNITVVICSKFVANVFVSTDEFLQEYFDHLLHFSILAGIKMQKFTVSHILSLKTVPNDAWGIVKPNLQLWKLHCLLQPNFAQQKRPLFAGCLHL